MIRRKQHGQGMTEYIIMTKGRMVIGFPGDSV